MIFNLYLILFLVFSFISNFLSIYDILLKK